MVKLSEIASNRVPAAPAFSWQPKLLPPTKKKKNYNWTCHKYFTPKCHHTINLRNGYRHKLKLTMDKDFRVRMAAEYMNRYTSTTSTSITIASGRTYTTNPCPVAWTRTVFSEIKSTTTGTIIPLAPIQINQSHTKYIASHYKFGAF